MNITAAAVWYRVPASIIDESISNDIEGYDPAPTFIYEDLPAGNAVINLRTWSAGKSFQFTWSAITTGAAAAADLPVTLTEAQLKAALAGVSPEAMRRVVIAYEPIWAIGTGNTATPEQAGEVCAAIRGVLRKLYGARIARSTTIQYGGSMNETNAEALLHQEDVDGGLIGTAALDPEKFLQIIQTANQD